jgi:hypothetical protein
VHCKGLERHFSRLKSLDASEDFEDRCITMHCRDGCGSWMSHPT